MAIHNFAAADRIDRILKAPEPVAIDFIGRLAGLRGQRRRCEKQRKGEQRQQGPAGKCLDHAGFIAAPAAPVVCEAG